MPGLGHDQDLTVEEVRYRIRSFAPDEFRLPLCFARCWTSVRKAKEGEVKGDTFAFLTRERTPRSAMPQGRILRGTAGSAKRAHVRSGNEISSGAESRVRWRSRHRRKPTEASCRSATCRQHAQRRGTPSTAPRRRRFCVIASACPDASRARSRQ
jgi:hypothetical protein